MAPQPLHIACAINANFALPLAVMLQSLKLRLDSNWQPVIHLAHACLPESTLTALSRILPLQPVRISDSQLKLATTGSRFPPEAAFPLWVAEALAPHIDRVLFLDADLLILDDLAQLYQLDLGGATLGAVVDVAVPRCSAPRGVKHWQTRGIPVDAPYFNGGVMLMDLKQWRTTNVTPRALQYLDETSEVVDFAHQEALNAVLWNQWQPLDRRWNLLASRAGRNFDPTHSPAWQDPGIIHFAGHMKPWRAAIGGPFAAPYRELLNRVAPDFPQVAPTTREQCAGFYDVHLRDILFPLEQWFWKRRLI